VRTIAADMLEHDALSAFQKTGFRWVYPILRRRIFTFQLDRTSCGLTIVALGSKIIVGPIGCMLLYNVIL